MSQSMTDQTTSSFHEIRRPLWTITGLMPESPASRGFWKAGRSIEQTQRNGKGNNDSIVSQKAYRDWAVQYVEYGRLVAGCAILNCYTSNDKPYATIHADK